MTIIVTVLQMRQKTSKALLTDGNIKYKVLQKTQLPASTGTFLICISRTWSASQENSVIMKYETHKH